MTFLFTYNVKHFTSMVPSVSVQICHVLNKLRDTVLVNPLTNQRLSCAQTQMQQCVQRIVTDLFFNELEIACWVKFVDKLNYNDILMVQYDA